jgi:TetR/AcrR family transcriptional regulator
MARRRASAGQERAPRSAPLASVRRLVPRETRRAQILEIAAGLFARHGFAGTTTRQIAAAVGTSETVLFRHFPTKDSLYAAILEHWAPAAELDRWLDGLRAIADRRDDEALFRAVVTAILESYRTHGVYHRLMLFAALEEHQLAGLAHAKFTTPLTSFLREYVARRQAEGAFTRMQPEFVVHMLLAVAVQHAQWTALGVNPLGLTGHDVARQAVALLAGLRARPAPPRAGAPVVSAHNPKSRRRPSTSSRKARP